MKDFFILALGMMAIVLLSFVACCACQNAEVDVTTQDVDDDGYTLEVIYVISENHTYVVYHGIEDDIIVDQYDGEPKYEGEPLSPLVFGSVPHP